MEELQGGREALIHRHKGKVYRPGVFWSPSVHQLLTHLRKEQFNSAPEPFGFDTNGNEAFIENIKDGHHLAYLNDIDYLTRSKHKIISNL